MLLGCTRLEPSPWSTVPLFCETLGIEAEREAEKKELHAVWHVLPLGGKGAACGCVGMGSFL